MNFGAVALAMSGALCIALLGAGTAPAPTEPPILVTPPKTPKGTTVTPPPSSTVPSYTDAQARMGQTLFYEHCAECHGAAGEGNWAPALLLETGNVQWQPVYYVYSYMQQHMPAGDANALRKDEYINIMAFLLKSHGHAAGSSALTDKTLMDSGALLGANQP